MSWYLNIMKENLSEADRRWLQQIWAPVAVGIPPSDALRSLCVMPDGEIRCYGERDKQTLLGGSGEAIYLSSRDCGLSWKAYPQPAGTLGSAERSPWSGKYISLRNILHGEQKGLYVYSSVQGPDDPTPQRRQIDNNIYQVILPPVAMVSRRRWLCGMHYVENHHYYPVVASSDDDGESWTLHHLPATPDHVPVWPHKGVRWQNSGAEPSVIELPDGRLMLLARTSLDVLYVYYSQDGGDSWTAGEPSDFHATLTTPALLRLHDKRVVLFWCNTQPLPELDKDTLWPPVGPQTKCGWAEDVFTNRDVNHAAVTSDGIHWQGFRELYLNELRNRADFRSCGGSISSADKSIHQFQAIELPYHKILVAFGQHEIARRMVIFDVNWLYENERHEDFTTGLDGLSTHVYCKSISGSTLYGNKRPGHCAWNRTNGALLVPDPDATYGEVLQLCRIHDPRLYSEVQGAVWNFSATQHGEITLELRIDGAGLRLSLSDRWFNPIDTTIAAFSHASVCLSKDTLSPGIWHTVRLQFNTLHRVVEVTADANHCQTLRIMEAAPHGLCYLHLQSLAKAEDSHGSYIRQITMKKID